MISILPNIETAARARRLLLASLALNLFFAGAAGAVAFRYTGAAPLTDVARIHYTVARRLDRIAATLPSTDARLMRSEIGADSDKIASAETDLRASRESLRNSLRAEPFDAAAMRATMAASRAARENFELVLHDVIASAAAKMSVVGRNKLADWSATRGAASTVQ